jgi:cytochrome c oxidase cbb3-type subunit 3
MKTRCRIALGAALALLTAGCEREMRRFDAPPPETSGVDEAQMAPLRAGPAASAPASTASEASAPSAAALPGSEAAIGSAASPPAGALVALGIDNRYEENAYAVSQGKRLFRWYNCNGCHANGGGGMGPPLMDDKWRYGAEPAQIVETILRGRPDGMPAFGGRIPEDQVWQIAAYVRSMSGQLRTDVAPSRSDSLSSGPPELRRDQLEPKHVGPGQ